MLNSKPARVLVLFVLSVLSIAAAGGIYAQTAATVESKSHGEHSAMDNSETRKTNLVPQAMFGAGCFWGVESAFRELEGVVETAAGYSGGKTEDPTYRDVCSHTTGHAEVVLVTYDPEKVSYEDLLEVFWNSHNPTQLNRQGPDVGDQYRSAIFYFTDEQKEVAEASKARLQKSGQYKSDIVTEITSAPTFYRAEEYHQQYWEKRGRKGCSLH